MLVNTFSGEPLVYLLDDDRSIRLAEPFMFCDSKGRIWRADTGDIANGTSYPPVLWSISGGPWSTKSRWPAIIHDVECAKRRHTWQDVHHMFGEALLVAGVPKIRAEFEFNMVWQFGPRWNLDGSDIVTPNLEEDYEFIGG